MTDTITAANSGAAVYIDLSKWQHCKMKQEAADTYQELMMNTSDHTIAYNTTGTAAMETRNWLTDKMIA